MFNQLAYLDIGSFAASEALMEFTHASLAVVRGQIECALKHLQSPSHSLSRWLPIQIVTSTLHVLSLASTPPFSLPLSLFCPAHLPVESAKVPCCVLHIVFINQS